MGNGAHFFRCDFQVHSPRDPAWSGTRPESEEATCDGGEAANQLLEPPSSDTSIPPICMRARTIATP
jgi:hypothetical protein